jgi:predicted lipoprotein with Yx(FWY)xxD motif
MRARRLSATVLSATLALGMIACGDDDEPTTTVAGGQTGGTTATTPAAAAPTTTTAPAAKATVATASTSLGTVLVDGAGKTLYTWDRDTGPTSTCVGNCAVTWPPLILPAGSTAPVPGPNVSLLTAVPRPDDATKLQVNWDNKPLYYYSADTAPGDVKGDGVGGTWHVVKVQY